MKAAHLIFPSATPAEPSSFTRSFFASWDFYKSCFSSGPKAQLLFQVFLVQCSCVNRRIFIWPQGRNDDTRGREVVSRKAHNLETSVRFRPPQHECGSSTSSSAKMILSIRVLRLISSGGF